MIENNDGSFSAIQPPEELLKALQEKSELLERAKAIHFGTEEELEAIKQERAEVSGVVRYYGETLQRIEEKVDMIIKYFGIVPIIGTRKEQA